MSETISNNELLRLAFFINSTGDGYLRDKLVALFNVEHDIASKEMIVKAIKDKHISEVEIQRIIKRCGVERADVSEIFKMIYDKGVLIDDGEKVVDGKDVVKMVTVKGSGIWKLRHYIKRHYGFFVVESDEVISDIKKSEFLDVKKHLNYVG